MLAVAVAYVAVACRCSTAVAPFVAVACATGRAGCSGMKIDPQLVVLFIITARAAVLNAAENFVIQLGPPLRKGVTDGRLSFIHI